VRTAPTIADGPAAAGRAVTATEAGQVASALFGPEGRNDPYPLYDRLRELEPVHFNPFVRMWFLTRHADCLAVLRDRRFSAELGQRLRRREEQLPASMLTSDPPEHTRLRRPANEAFAMRNLEQLRSRLPGIVSESLDRLPTDGPVDLVSSFAGPFALRVLAELFAVPDGDLVRFAQLTLETAANLDPLAAPEDQQRATAATRALGGYFHEHLARADASSGSDVLDSLVASRDDGALGQADLVGICVLCVVGGHEPLTSLIANGALSLLRHPDRLARVREAPIGDAAPLDEVVRFESPIQFVARVAREDVRLGAHTIGAGDPVVALLGAANRDPDVFGDGGGAAAPHLAFGAGVHRCLGSSVTELAAGAALGGLIRAFPGLELVDEDVVWRASLVPRGPAALPVRL
jgi:cytochrome P450